MWEEESPPKSSDLRQGLKEGNTMNQAEPKAGADAHLGWADNVESKDTLELRMT